MTYQIRCLIVAIAVSTSAVSARATEQVTWEQLQQRLRSNSSCSAGPECEAHVRHRSIAVIATDGEVHHTRELVIDGWTLALINGSYW